MKNIQLKSNFDNLPLSLAIFEVEKPLGIVQIIHGMSEHKERYFAFCLYLNTLGFSAIISDLRGHGESISPNLPLGHFGKQGMQALINDQLTITHYLKETYSLPITLFGHSMGSIIGRVLLQENDNLFRKIILSGVPNYQFAVHLGIPLIHILTLFKGSKGNSLLVEKMVTGAFNKKISPANIKNAWLSYNELNVESYNNDPLCGFPFTLNGYKTLFQLMKRMHKKRNYNGKNNQLPILILVGIDDPCTGSKKGLKDSLGTLSHIYQNISLRSFQGMRHEILNEKDYTLVLEEIKQFLK